MVRQKKLQDQMPMEFMLPETDWTEPTTLPDLRDHGDLVFDVETRDEGLAAGTGPAWFRRGGFVVGISVTSRHDSIYVPIRHPDTINTDKSQVSSWLRDLVRRPTGRNIYQNAPYDLGWMLMDLGVPVPEHVDDTLAQAFMLNEERLPGTYNLSALCKDRGLPVKDEALLRAAAEAYGYDPKSEMWKLPARYVGPYGMQDGRSTLALFDAQKRDIETPYESRHGWTLEAAYQLEADLIPLCLEMQRRGVRVNTSRAEQTMDEMLRRRDELLLRLEDHIQIGRHLSIDDLNSPRWMTDVFTRLGIQFPRTEKGNESFSNEWMSKTERGSVPWMCARARQFHDAGSKFIGNYILGFTHMGRIHAAIHQYKTDDGGARTTRFSYSDPPLQQMPSRDDEIAKFIRGCFEPEPGEVWAAVDYSQQEYRMMTHFANVCHMAGIERTVQMYREDPKTDFHNMVVQITGLIRRQAKDVNFAKAFGAGVPKFALMVNIPLDEARRQMEQYDEEMPWVKRFGEYMQKLADQRGWIRMIDGALGRFEQWEPRWISRDDLKERLEARSARGLPFPALNPCSRAEADRRRNDPDHPWYGERLKRAKTHKAMNKLVQGSAARQMKMAMRQCWREGIVPLLQMHDELDLSVADPRTAERVGEIMAGIVELTIPVLCDVEYGSNWGRAAKDPSDKRRSPDGHRPTWENAIADMEAA